MTMYATVVSVKIKISQRKREKKEKQLIKDAVTNLNCKLQILFPLVPVYGQEVGFGLCPKLGWLGAFLVEDGRAEGGVED